MTSARCIHLGERGLLAIAGPDRAAFLQGLVSNDVHMVSPSKSLYAGLLTPQGKYLFDFIMASDGERLLLECEARRVEDLRKRLSIYRLRSRVELDDVSADYRIHVVWGADALEVLGLPDDPGATVSRQGGLAMTDPRRSALGARLLLPAATDALTPPIVPGDPGEWHALRIRLGVPDGARDLEVGKTVLLEAGFDELNGIDWDKGCYMGQELTARTRYRGLVKRRLMPVVAEGTLPEAGTPVTLDGRQVGEVRSGVGNSALAVLRLAALERQDGDLMAGDARIRPCAPMPLPA